jgi:hypothetical protein
MARDRYLRCAYRSECTDPNCDRNGSSTIEGAEVTQRCMSASPRERPSDALCRYCCKSPKLPGDNFPATRRTDRRPAICVLSIVLPKSPVNSSSGDEVPHIFTRKSRLWPGEFLIASAKRLLQHGVIPGSCHTKARGISSPGRPTSWGLAIMESRNGALCRTGRVAEADSDLHCRSDRKDRARRGCCIQPGGNRRIHQVACAACCTDRT